MKVLVCEDSEHHIAAAKHTLRQHECIIAENLLKAMDQLRSNMFDAVLTDLYFGENPDGLLIATNAAARLNIQTAICSDIDGHKDQLGRFLLRDFGREWKKSPVVFIPMSDVCVEDHDWDAEKKQIVLCEFQQRKVMMKDWLRVLEVANGDRHW